MKPNILQMLLKPPLSASNGFSRPRDSNCIFVLTCLMSFFCTRRNEMTAYLTLYIMKTILAATDYTDLAENAVHYAASIARQYDYKLILIITKPPVVCGKRLSVMVTRTFPR